MKPLVLIACIGSVALAQEPSPAPAASKPPPSWPRLGGHLGTAIPIVTVTGDGTSVIGRDFVQVGITPGLTVKLSEHWLIDFEFIAAPVWTFGKSGMPDKVSTVWVVDPGVLYALPHLWTVGLRAAVAIGEGQPFNYGLVPIVVKGFKVTNKLVYFLEYDLPIFVNATPGHTTWAITPCQIQTGFGF